MSDDTKAWTIRLTDAAAEDFKSIIRWTIGQFGEQQARVHTETLSAALRDLRFGPTLAGVRVRDDIANGILTLHLARRGRKARHFVMFRIAAHQAHVVEVLRLLHDAMDPPRHLPPLIENE